MPVTALPPRQTLVAKAATCRYKNLTPYPQERGVYHANQNGHDEYTRVHVSELCHKEFTRAAYRGIPSPAAYHRAQRSSGIR